MYCKAKKNFGVFRKFFKIFIFQNLLQKNGLKGGILIYADFGPPRYSSVPNRRACTIINFGGKSPTYMTLFGPTRLLILRNFSNLHVYSILQAY